MSSKITIIGAGSVGSTIAYTLSNEDIASEIVLIDINKKKVEGEVMDIAQGTCFRDPVSIIAGEYEDAKDSDIVIITSGIARKPGQTRIELTQTNVNILKSITPEIVKAAPNAIYIIVSNPVDIMTYVFTKISDFRKTRSLVPVPCWIPQDFAADCLNTSTLPRKTSTLTYSVSTAILPSFRGAALTFPVSAWTSTTRP